MVVKLQEFEEPLPPPKGKCKSDILARTVL